MSTSRLNDVNQRQVSVVLLQAVLLHVIWLDIEEDEECRYDTLNVFKGTALLVSLCGKIQGRDVRVLGPRVNLEFLSDASTVAAGFKLEYRLITVGESGECALEGFPTGLQHKTRQALTSSPQLAFLEKWSACLFMSLIDFYIVLKSETADDFWSKLCTDARIMYPSSDDVDRPLSSRVVHSYLLQTPMFSVRARTRVRRWLTCAA